ncbi:MAG: hypothetical protein LBU39_08545 [Desulfobulbaceae bacterium]|jgi:phage tail sheath protein FI|nr:hypothetical protein [Desulfobulbaceae bacterium]
MPAYRHGVYVNEVPTSLTPMRHVEARMPVVFGLAPIHLAPGANAEPPAINKPTLCHSYADFVATFGASDDPAFTLCQAARIFFRLYAVGPVVFVNVFDPTLHVADEADEAAGVEIGDPDPSQVTSADILGGVVTDTGVKTGLELVDSVFPMFRLVPGQILCPGFSHIPAVAQAMQAKADEINTMFKALTVVDLPVDYYTEAPGWKNANNYAYANMICCCGAVLNGDERQFLSTHLAALAMEVDEDNDDIPFVSPSNHSLRITGFTIGGQVVNLGIEQANYLNGEGIVTAINFDGGWKLWGNRTAVYPSNTDPKDSFIPIRSFFNWLGKTLILSYWSRIDMPIRRRFIQNALDSANVYLNGLAAREIILGGRCVFTEDENPVTDLMDGICRFHVFVTPPTPAREIDFTLEYDPAYFSTLFA